MQGLATYGDIPGTTVFDAERSRQGYHLDQFCMSLMKPASRERFKRGECDNLNEWPMSEAQRKAVLARDWNLMIALGGDIYFLAKLSSTDGHCFLHIAALMTGVSQESYAGMMLVGGRSPEGNRCCSEWLRCG
jgi:protocatechuate 4,5-dioxygenase, alpha chain